MRKALLLVMFLFSVLFIKTDDANAQITCTLNLLPSTSTFSVGSSIPLTATFTSTSIDPATVTVTFSTLSVSTPTIIVSPTSDSTLPFTTNVTGVSVGTTTLIATANLGASTGICSDSSVITVIAPPTSTPTPIPTIAPLPTSTPLPLAPAPTSFIAASSFSFIPIIFDCGNPSQAPIEFTATGLGSNPYSIELTCVGGSCVPASQFQVAVSPPIPISTWVTNQTFDVDGVCGSGLFATSGTYQATLTEHFPGGGTDVLVASPISNLLLAAGTPIPTTTVDPACQTVCDNDGFPTSMCTLVDPPGCTNSGTDCNIGGTTYDCFCCGALPTGPPAIDPTCVTSGGNDGINTAIGCIPADDSNAFVAFLLRWALGIGGGLAFLLILYAGFQITTSAGNPDKIKAGQELLTAAIAGILLIIFSVFVLQLIGVRIFALPGF